jgi:hypothetical protein
MKSGLFITEYRIIFGLKANATRAIILVPESEKAQMHTGVSRAVSDRDCPLGCWRVIIKRATGNASGTSRSDARQLQIPARCADRVSLQPAVITQISALGCMDSERAWEFAAASLVSQYYVV